MEEDCEVSRPRLQQVYALKGATLSVNLTEREKEKESEGDQLHFQLMKMKLK